MFVDVPAAGADLGFMGLDYIGTWRMIAVRRGTPPEIQDALRRAFRAVYDSEEYREWAAENGLDLIPGWMEPEEAEALWRETYTNMVDLFTRLGRI